MDWSLLIAFGAGVLLGGIVMSQWDAYRERNWLRALHRKLERF